MLETKKTESGRMNERKNVADRERVEAKSE